MKINANNISKIEAILNQVQKRAKTRLVSAEEIRDMARKAEAHMERFGICKKDAAGCVYTYAEKIGCNSYGTYFADSTYVELTRGSKDWFLTDCKRAPFGTSRGPRDDHFHATEKAIKSAMNQLRENLERI